MEDQEKKPIKQPLHWYKSYKQCDCVKQEGMMSAQKINEFDFKTIRCLVKYYIHQDCKGIVTTASFY